MRANNGFRLGKIFGVEIEIDWSWLFIFALLAWSMSAQLYRAHPAWTPALPLVVGVLGSLLFFGSVLLHELAHTLAAKRRGLNVERIRLFLFGGVSNIEREPRTPKDEAIITVVGPLTSFALALVFGGLAGALARLPQDVQSWEVASRLGPLPTLLAWLASANFIVAVFNLVPGFPLDGGRILRSILWAITGDAHRATVWATSVTYVIAWSLVALGILMAFGTRVPFLGVGVGAGIWMALIGWFLGAAATQSRARVYIEEALSGTRVATLMRTTGRTVDAQTPVAVLVREGFMGSSERAYPILEGDRLIGLACMEDLRKIDSSLWEVTPVREIMTPLDRLITVTPNSDAAEALQRMATHDVNQLPVVEGEHLVGMVYRSDFLRWLELHRATLRARPA